MLSIYEYQNPNDFLRDTWNFKRRKNSAFTVRAWAFQMSMKHHNALHEMVTGKRKIPKSTIPTFSRFLNLNNNEAFYFELMVDYSRSKTAEEKTIYLERMKAVSPVKAVKFTELESFRMLQDPVHFFIAELALQKDFRPDPQWIKDRLGYNTTFLQITEAIDRLLALDILREDVEGKLHRIDQFIQSKSDIQDRGLKEYHKTLMDLAKEAIETQDILEREYQGMALTIDSNRLPEAKKVIRKFVAEFTSQFDTPKVANEEVYQLNLQFFGITKNINKGRKQ
jgi:uncharacterized protein (TIGR02147 family)